MDITAWDCRAICVSLFAGTKRFAPARAALYACLSAVAITVFPTLHAHQATRRQVKSLKMSKRQLCVPALSCT